VVQFLHEQVPEAWVHRLQRRIKDQQLPADRRPARLVQRSCGMPTVVAAEGVILDHILETTDPVSREGLSQEAYGRFDTAQRKTAWGRRHQRRVALVNGTEVLASAKQYDFVGNWISGPCACAVSARCSHNRPRPWSRADPGWAVSARRSGARRSGCGASLLGHGPGLGRPKRLRDHSDD
jgi:hypothetical protein